jgi:hypothetical protein
MQQTVVPRCQGRSFYFIGIQRLDSLTSWEARQEIPQIFWNPKVHYRVHNSPSRAPVLGQMNPVHALPSCFFKICFNIVFTSMHWSSKWWLSLRFPYEKPVCSSFNCMHAMFPTNLILFDLMIRVIFGKDYRLWSPPLCFLHPPIESSWTQISSSAACS